METLDYHISPPPRRLRLPRVTLRDVASGFTIVLSIVSVCVVYKGANDEPYMQHRSSDEFVQVVFATALIVVWCAYATGSIALVVARRLPRRWLLAFLWAAVCVFYLNEGRAAYLSDIERFVPAASRW
jgi:hypothetical protein